MIKIFNDDLITYVINGWMQENIVYESGQFKVSMFNAFVE
jgi:hypothetical protein